MNIGNINVTELKDLKNNIYGEAVEIMENKKYIIVCVCT